MKKIDYHEIKTIIYCQSGLRIGTEEDLLQIGAVDRPCIKHPVTLQPYIPGTSIKGKMRCELEQRLGKLAGGGTEPCGCAAKDCLICRVFGPHKRQNHELGPTRIVVRDATCVRGGETEVKCENTIDRKNGAALNPRPVERVVSGSEFLLRIGIQIWDLDEQVAYKNKNQQAHKGSAAMVEFIKDGLRAVQETGLGSAVSKGSVEIEFRQLTLDGAPFEL